MKTLKELTSLTENIFKTDWTRRNGQSVPESESVKLGNDAVDLEATILYADMAQSTDLVIGYKDWFAAQIYKSYLLCACELIRNNSGAITAFDGDRVMAAFIGDTKNTNACRCALQINWIVKNVVNPAIRKQYPTTAYELKQAVGVDVGSHLIARTGVRGANDLVWVGRSANLAAKLCALREGNYTSFITEAVFNSLNDSAKYGGDPKRCMWEKTMWTDRGVAIYKSSWWWKPE